MSNLQVNVLTAESKITRDLDIVIIAGGFEDRAFAIISNYRFSPTAQIVLIAYKNDIKGNAAVSDRYIDICEQKYPGRYSVVELKNFDVVTFRAKLRETLRGLSANLSKVGLDISGMSAHCIFATLDAVRERFPYSEQVVLYTSAKDYTPTKDEYRSLVQHQGEEIDFIPHSMALEMSENLIFEPFAGYRSGESKTCLALFAGYEAHRSTGVVDVINPAILLLLYGQPGDHRLDWRLDLSKRLHAKFERTRRCAVEIVSTRNVIECVDKLDEYYNYLMDDYDLTIAPICSKLQMIATFVFWERYPEVQISFPIPIGYDPRRRPSGVGSSSHLSLPARLPLDSS